MASRLRRFLAALGDSTSAFRRPQYGPEDRLASVGLALTFISVIASVVFGDDDGQIILAAALIFIITTVTWVTGKVIRSRQRP